MTGSIPITQVMQMKQQGLNDNQIIQTLQRDGFNSQQIFDAMSQSEIKGGVAGPAPMFQPNMPMPSPMPPPMGMPMQPPNMGMSMGNPQDDIMRDKIEEIAEGLIDEKWQELIDQVNKIIEWKDGSEKQIAQIEQKFEDLQREFDKVHSALISRVEESQRAITGVGTDVKAMSTVFQKILPGFIDNVTELSRITEKMGGKSKKVEMTKEDMFVPPKKKIAEPINDSDEDNSVEDRF